LVHHQFYWNIGQIPTIEPRYTLLPQNGRIDTCSTGGCVSTCLPNNQLILKGSILKTIIFLEKFKRFFKFPSQILFENFFFGKVQDFKK